MHLSKTLPLCAFLFANLLIGVTAQGGTQNPFDDDDDPAPAPAPNPAPPAPNPNPPAPNPNPPAPNPAPVDPAAGNQASYSCPADDGKRYYTGGVTFQLKCNHGTRAKHLRTSVANTLKECADQCAAASDCQSCDWNAPNGCQQKGEYIPTFPLAGQMTWFPTEERKPSCPTNRSPTEIKDPALVTTPECPNDNDKSYMAPDGTYFYMKCCAHGASGKEIARAIQPTLQACMDYCASVDLCKGAQYTNRDKAGSQEPLHTCILYDEGKFSNVPCGNDAHDTAFTIDPPTADHPSQASVMCSTECPYADGQQYESKYGEVFHMDCSKRHGTKYLYTDTQATFKDCMDACAKLVPCHSVDYQWRTRTCYYSNHQGEPTIDATGFNSAHSLGCAGACREKSDGCGCGAKSEL